MLFSSCTDDLNVIPEDDDIFLTEAFFSTPESYRHVFKSPCGVKRMRLHVPQNEREYAAITPIVPLKPAIL